MQRPDEVLTCGQVTLRRWRPDDADLIFHLVTESLEHLRPWMPWVAGYGPHSAVAYLSDSQQSWEAGTAFNYAIGYGAAVVGSCGLMARIGPGGLEIGYWVHPSYTGRGLATDAAAALTQAAFALPGIDRVEILHDANNVASGRVPRKLGFAEVGRRPSRLEQRAPSDSGTSVAWRLTR